MLSTIWDLFIERGEFPTFRQIDRRLDQQLGLDAYAIVQSIPDGLIYGSRTPSDQDNVGVTVAGAAVLPRANELLGLFVDAVRYGAELHRTWAGLPTEATDDPVIKGAALPHAIQMPASGRDQLLRCLQVLLENENWGWKSASHGLEWTFTLDRRVRAFRDVIDVHDYLVRRYGPDTPPPIKESALDGQPTITPSERLAIVDNLAKMSGPDSEAFFAAHGLGLAYQSVGDGSSKKGHINAALREAEQQGRMDEILSLARSYLLREPAHMYSAARTAPARSSAVNIGSNTGSPKLSELRLFVSHAFADVELAKALKNSLVLGGVPNARIFFSSQRSSGIPVGKNVRQHLQEELAGSGLVVELLTPAFLERPMCLLELGAAWGLGKATCPIVVPPLTVSAAKEAIGDVLMSQIGTDDDIDDAFGDLADQIGKELDITMPRQQVNEAVRTFKSYVKSLPAVTAKPSRIIV